jgi:hypothetical protein
MDHYEVLISIYAISIFPDVAMELGNASKLVTDFHSAYPAKPGPFRSLHVPSPNRGEDNS